MADYADLMIEVSRQAENQYWVELNFSQSNGQTEQAPSQGPARFDFNALRQASLQPEQYGRILKDALFTQPDLRDFYNKCLASAGGARQPLRLRLLIDRSAVELQNLRWETMRDVEDVSYLAIDANRPFSRFLHSSDWQRVELRSKGDLKALVVVANPKNLQGGIDLGGKRLAEVDVAGEVARAREALHGLSVIDVLESVPDVPGQVTVEKIQTALGRGYDIFYLTCHGALLFDDPQDPNSVQRPYLILEREDGSYETVDGNRLVTFVRSQPATTRPRLVVLASCQSGGQGQTPDGDEEEAPHSIDQGALASLGPRLVEAGIPAVIAMQDNVQMNTIRLFMPEFFRSLVQDGQVDRAMAVARNVVRERPDWWVPVLYLRLRGGLLWYEPGFEIGTTDFVGWPNIIDSIKQGYCVPILGFGLLERLIGSPREIARSWAREAGFPLDPHSREDLPQVAQYLSIQQSWAYVRNQLLEFIRGRLVKDFGDVLPTGAEGQKLDQVSAEIGQQRRQSDPYDPYTTLASLPFKIYITANPDNLLEQALQANHRPPIVMYSRWNRRLINREAIRESENLPEPTQANPLVYHLFGSITDPRSMVVTEDDYFEYMMWVNNPSAQVPLPEPIMTAWRDDALLFLGFQMSDWNFRVLFRSILNEERRESIRDYRSVSVQLQPGDGYLLPEKARRYLERAFTQQKLDIYWGSGEDFLHELKDRWR